jgi:hypothetical protein
MSTDDIYQLFIEHNVKGVRREAGRCFLGVNMGDAGVIGEALQARHGPSPGQRALQAGEPGLEAEQAAPLAAAPHNNDALAAPLAQQAETVPKAAPGAAPLEVQLCDVDLEVEVAERTLALKRKHHELSDLDHAQELKHAADKLKHAADELKHAADKLQLDRQQFELRREQLQLDRQQFELRKEREQWDIARQTQLQLLELKSKQALAPE